MSSTRRCLCIATFLAICLTAAQPRVDGASPGAAELSWRAGLQQLTKRGGWRVLRPDLEKMAQINSFVRGFFGVGTAGGRVEALAVTYAAEYTCCSVAIEEEDPLMNIEWDQYYKLKVDILTKLTVMVPSGSYTARERSDCYVRIRSENGTRLFLVHQKCQRTRIDIESPSLVAQRRIANLAIEEANRRAGLSMRLIAVTRFSVSISKGALYQVWCDLHDDSKTEWHVYFEIWQRLLDRPAVKVIYMTRDKLTERLM